LLQRVLLEDPREHALPDHLDDVYTDGDTFHGLTVSDIDALREPLSGA